MIDEVTHLCNLAMQFAEVNRTGVYLHNGQAESDTDHTVMLGWLACALAQKWYQQLDLGLVAQYALVHDAPEIYAGDVQSLGMSQETANIKKHNEQLAIKRIEAETTQLSWFAKTINAYESQQSGEARFVRAVDKVLPKIVAWLNDLKWLIDNRTWEELQEQLCSQYADIESYAGEFTELLRLYVQCARRIINGLAAVTIS